MRHGAMMPRELSDTQHSQMTQHRQIPKLLLKLLLLLLLKLELLPLRSNLVEKQPSAATGTTHVGAMTMRPRLTSMRPALLGVRLSRSDHHTASRSQHAAS
jgi:uncharacterized membrane protein